MNTVWKFPLEVQDEQTIMVPLGATILHVGVQDEIPCLWVLVDPSAEATKRLIYTAGTGHPIPPNGQVNHLGTYMLHEGRFVGHVFEVVMPS